MLATPNARIGDVLRQCGMVDERQLDEAQAYARREGIRIGEALVAMGVLDRDRAEVATRDFKRQAVTPGAPPHPHRHITPTSCHVEDAHRPRIAGA